MSTKDRPSPVPVRSASLAMGVLAGLSSDKPGAYLKSDKALDDMASAKSPDVVSAHVGMALGSFLRHCAKCVLA